MEISPPLEFIHVPQTGGEAIENAWTEYKWGSLRFPPFDISRRSPWHNDIFLKSVMKGRTCFGIIRDPVERILEIYKRWEYPDSPLIFNQTIEKWAEQLKTVPFLLDNNLKPQTIFLNLCKHIVLYDEFLEENVNKVLQNYKIPKRPLSPETQKTRYYRINKATFSPENMEWIKDFYKEDFALLEKVVENDGVFTKTD